MVSGVHVQWSVQKKITTCLLKRRQVVIFFWTDHCTCTPLTTVYEPVYYINPKLCNLRHVKHFIYSNINSKILNIQNIIFAVRIYRGEEKLKSVWSTMYIKFLLCCSIASYIHFKLCRVSKSSGLI